MSQDEIASVASRLYDWARSQDFSGHDPHDLLASPLLGRLQNPLARLIALQLGRRSVINLRTMLRVPRAENPKALALFLSGLLRARENVLPEWKNESRQLAKRLVASMSDNGWGYPFPWQSRTHYLAPKQPNIVTTSFAGIALIESARAFKTDNYHDAILRASEYIMYNIPRYELGGLAFGYAANDPQIVFNASLLGAEFLAKAGTLLGRDEYLGVAKRAAEFVVRYQQADGSWRYGLEQSQTWIDSFHTGFVILSLQEIGRILDAPHLTDAARRGFDYYRNMFIEPDFAVRYFANKRYPIDAHALGQAMQMLAVFGDRDAARNIAAWSAEHILSPNGYFYYQRHRLFTNRIAYMRWSNAWMFRGLCEVISTHGDRA